MCTNLMRSKKPPANAAALTYLELADGAVEPVSYGLGLVRLDLLSSKGARPFLPICSLCDRFLAGTCIEGLNMFPGEFVEFGVEDVEEFVARWFRWSLALCNC